MSLIIREEEKDHRAVEELTREAFGTFITQARY
jgi:predicted N-acetyltransferase YhbS